MTLDEVRKRILDNIDDPDGSVWTDTRIDRLVNDAIQDLAIIAERVDPVFGTITGSTNLSFTGDQTIDAGAAGTEVELPSDFRRLISATRTLPAPAKQIQIVPMEHAHFYRGIDAGLVAYIREKTTLPDRSLITTLSNIKSATFIGFPNLAPGEATWTYGVLYAARVGTVTSPNTALPLPGEYHHLVAIGATVKALMGENSPDAAGWQKQYDSGISILTAGMPNRDGVLTEY